MKKIFVILFSFLLFFSCNTQKEIVYMQDIEEIINKNPDKFKSPTIQKGDLLSIVVSSQNMLAVAPYNVIVGDIASSSNLNTRGQSKFQTYLVDSDGNIDFPNLGRIRIEGLSRQDLALDLQNRIKKFVKDAIVTVQILNFRYTVLGEVKSPGVYQSTNEKTNVLEAIGQAKDLTIYGRRDSILLIRHTNNKIEKYFIDLRSASFIDSSYYYLRQNDIVYIQPNKVKTRNSKLSPFNPLIISIASTLIALTTLLISVFK